MTTEYLGAWTPQAPYGPQDEDDRDADRQILLDMQIPGGLDRRDLYSGFHLYMVPEAW